MNIELVLHTDYGGFHIDDEIALWLMENRGWTISKKVEDDGTDLYEYSSDYFVTRKHKSSSVELRSNPDLIDCVRELQKLHKDDDFREKHYGYIHKLRVVKIEVKISIEDYHDGRNV